MIGKVVTLLFILSWTGPSLAQDSPEKDILATAIKVFASISPDEDIKTRLRKQELTIRKIDEIVELYSGTDTGLELLSTDKFGKFDVQRLREQYLKELITFNLKTCESTPSFTCLGFVSLDNGSKACDKPKEFSQFLTASNNFHNAYRIFKSQGDAKKNELGVLSSYRQCANRAPNNFSRDFINSRLVNILLENGDESKAVGITQNMTTRLFKIIATADIRVAQGKYDYPTFKTILASAESLAPEGDKDPSAWLDRETALFFLSNKLFEVGLNPFSKEASDSGIVLSFESPLYSPKQTSPPNAKYVRCNSREEYYSELAIDYLFHAGKGADTSLALNGNVQPPPIIRIGLSSINYSNSMQSAFKIANYCHNYNADSILQFIGSNPDVARQLRAYQLKNGTGEKEGVDFFLQTLTVDQILDNYNLKTDRIQMMNDGMKGAGAFTGGDGFPKDFFKNFIYPFYGKYGQFSIFKLFVDAGDVCNASSKLFQEIRGGEYEDDAVSYFISSPNISVDKKYTCGDADLDLLLN
ncbi:MAG: hypothetical protein P8J93_06265 [SAR86 cluster bacterium]|nr:hypothetical protein [SAR86 cluster bacterium]